MAYRTPRARVSGLGSAKSGTSHWWEQRITSVALVVLTPLFVIPFAYNLGEGYDRALAAYSHPFNAITAIAFIVTAFLHLYQGLQVVIEDYVHHKRTEIFLIIGVRLFCALAALVGVYSVIVIALRA
ncbi:MAG: succinate dehydrogenase, hydrophobic membrane anchor protein [Alphaproteobacteria bacterium HGW-Alphaproteobacteria-2]|nr:MAG: succinate dehydrogenase, hydrophobic membrane anchor protein [Alphaproteobacteria bacterium HGW-Alphaproteobacteria-2]